SGRLRTPSKLRRSRRDRKDGDKRKEANVRRKLEKMWKSGTEAKV
ncbi:uncharacterized, partial [Tachysurus ichikawai]